MLKKVKVKLAVIGITSVMGAGSLFSGIAAQNVHADESAEADIMETSPEESGVPGTSDDNATGGANNRADSLSAGETEVQQDASEAETEDNVNNNSLTENKKTAGMGATKETGSTYAAEAVRAKNGWVKEKGGYKYYKNGKAYTGWHKMGKAEGEKTAHWCYFGKNGVMYTGWKKMGKAEGEKTAHWCYFGSNGWMRTGWVQFGKGTSNPDGGVKKHWSYFGSNGWMRTGWVQFGKGTANPDGNVAKHWSYFGSNGWLRTGWVQLGKGTSEPDGNVAKHWSYFGSNGWMRTGWVQFGKGTSEPDGNVAKHWSFFGDNGWMRTGWQDMGKGTKNPDGNSAKHRSYFGSNGWLRTGNKIIDDDIYSFNDSGWLLDAYYVDWEKKGAAYYKKIKGYEPYEVAYYYSGEKGSVPQLVIREKKGGKIANFGTFKLDLSTGIGVDINNGTTVDFTKY